MKITNYFFLIKLNVIFIILLSIECLRLSSETYSKEKLTFKNHVEEHSTMNMQTGTEKTDKNLAESSKVNLSKKNLSESSLTTKNCNPLCSQCSTNDLNYCTLCRTGIIFYNYSCYLNCPEGTFLNQQTRSCQLCHHDCPICWGPEKDMCGNTFGSRTQVVSLENEIIEYFNTHVFVKDEVDYWLNSLKMMFLKDKSEIIYPLFANDNPEFSVYIDEKTLTEIPIGSFSYKGGLFIPVPPYIDKFKRLIEFHWTYKRGMWDGTSWHDQYYPRLPTFIKYKGSTNKIYQEDNGFWYYDAARQWVYVYSNRVIQTTIPIRDKISTLNKIKIDVIFHLIYN